MPTPPTEVKKKKQVKPIKPYPAHFNARTGSPETMKNLKEIEDKIKARTAERDSLIASHNAMWKKRSAELVELQELHKTKLEAMNQEGAQNQLKVTGLDYAIKELQALIPKPKPEKGAKKK